MSLLKLKPACKDYLWGGTTLADKYKKAGSGSKIAETWELSCYPESPSIIENGEYAGLSLSEYINRAGKNVLGKNCERFDSFPVLIKLIDAADDLSIQVHPDNAYALKHEAQYGKTEMWYIVDAAEGAGIYYGFNRDITKPELKKRIEDNTLLDVLNFVPVKSGDVFFIEAGTVHSICKGILTVEIQQSSDVTYRIYDYGRKDKDGNTRPLHIGKALDVARLSPVGTPEDFGPHLAKCDYFTADKLIIDDLYRGSADSDSFVHLLFLNGEGGVKADGEEVRFRPGDSIFIPAGTGSFEIHGQSEVIATFES